MRISKITEFSYSKPRHTQYAELYKRIRVMKMGGAIEIVLDKSDKEFDTVVRSNFKIGRFGFRLAISRKDKECKTWWITKCSTDGYKAVSRVGMHIN
jgi:hypothetical protein